MKSLEFIKTEAWEGYSVTSIKEFLPEHRFKEFNALMHLTNRSGTVHEGKYVIFKDDFAWFCKIIGLDLSE